MESAEGVQANATPGAQAADHTTARHICHVPEVVEAFIPALPMVVKWEAAFIVLLESTSRLFASNPSPSDSGRCPSWLLSSLSPLVTGHLRRPTAECVAPRMTSPGGQVLFLFRSTSFHAKSLSSFTPRRCKASRAQPGARHSSSGQGASA